MLPPNDVRKNMDRLHPVGGKFEYMYVTEESKQNTCNKCGACCALFMIWADDDSMETFALHKTSGEGKDARFGLEHWGKVNKNEACARGVEEGAAEQARSCDMLGEDNLCSCYEDRPPTCRAHPGRVGQTVHKRCAFAGTSDPAKAQPYVHFDKMKVTVELTE